MRIRFVRTVPPTAWGTLMRLVLVIAVSKNGVIGRAGGLPWKLSSDLKLFRRLTMGKPVIMGRKTYHSIGKPLDGRRNIVVTRGPAIGHPDVITAGTIEAALALATGLAALDRVLEVMVIGGGEIYRQSLPYATRLYLTEVDIEVEGDTCFPEINPTDWLELSREPHQAGPRDSADFVFRVLDRVSEPRELPA